MNKNFILGTVLGVVLALIIAGSAFYIFTQRQEVETEASAIRDLLPTATLPQSSSTTATATFNTVEFNIVDVFTARPRSENVSNIIGYLAYGAFVINVPDWTVEHWASRSGEVPGSTVFYPRNLQGPRDFSDIVVNVLSSREDFNAEYLYDRDRTDSIAAAPMITESFLNDSQDTIIYHVQRSSTAMVYDTFYLDGFNSTATISFSANRENYGKHGPKVREFVRGLGKGGQPQG